MIIYTQTNEVKNEDEINHIKYDILKNGASLSYAKIPKLFKLTILKDKAGTIYGWTSNGNIYLTKDGMNPRTLLYEYTHLWFNAMQVANPENSIRFSWAMVIKPLYL